MLFEVFLLVDDLIVSTLGRRSSRPELRSGVAAGPEKTAASGATGVAGAIGWSALQLSG